MTRQDYIEFILDHYNNPHHKGKLEDPDLMVNGRNPGCAISMAAASLVMDKIIGKTIAEVDNMDYSELLEDLGREVVQSRIRCATLAMDTIKAGAREYPSHKATGKKLVSPIILSETF